MTRWYEAYYEVMLGGRFGDQIIEWHKQYGPIVRVNPFEIHIDDPDYYDALFNFDPHLEKRVFAMDNLVFTPSSAQHKMRRQALQSFFSRANIQRVEYMIHDGLAKVCRKFQQARANEEPLRISLLFRCLMADVICEYAFGESFHFLDNLQWSEGFFSATETTMKGGWLFRESRLMHAVSMVMMGLPEWLVSQKSMKELIEWAKALRSRVDAAMDRGPAVIKGQPHKTIFEEYKTNNLPPSEKTNDRLFQTAFMIVGAGFGSSSFALDTATYHICANPEIHQRLKAELRETWLDETNPAPPVATLEKLPYLKACIQEALRLALGTMTRLQRVNNHSAMQYGDWFIPASTPISMSVRLIHHNQDIFPNSQKYDPERWLLGEESKALEKHLVTFSRGSRSCLAMHMAYAEMFLTLATVFRRFNIELHNTTRLNVDPKFDFFFPVPERPGRVTVLVK
ncbi:hypothetical protein MMC11_007035 [Xylographa trunciseda]|nr:hypothetical protein [Xylographa trunciseda]